MNQFQIRLHGLPIVLVLISNGQIGFTKLGPFATIFDGTTVISEEDLVVDGEVILYNTAYNISEKLKKWLVSLELDNPFEEN